MGGVNNIRTSHEFEEYMAVSADRDRRACCTDVQRIRHDTQRHPRLGLKHAFRGMQAACKRDRTIPPIRD